MTSMYWLVVALGGAVGAMGSAGIAATLTTGAVFPSTPSLSTSSVRWRWV